VEVMPKARAAAARAVELDALLGEGHLARALSAFLYEWDWALARDEFERVMSAGPMPAYAQHWYALFLCACGQPDQGLQVARRAQTLDPLSLTVEVTVARCLYYGRRFEDAIGILRSHLERNPGSIQGYVTLYRALRIGGMLPEALLELERGISLLGRVPILLSWAGNVHARLGRREQALALLEELRQLGTQRHIPPAYLAEILFGLGDLDEAFALWNLAAEQRSGWMAFLWCDPAWDSLRSDPRYAALTRRLGVEP